MRNLSSMLAAAVLMASASAASADAVCEEPADEAAFPSHNGISVVKLKWSSTTEGTLRVQLSTHADFARMLVDRSVRCCEATLRNIEVGRYHWRVLTESEDGSLQEECRASFEVIRAEPAR
jgi:hypothetical protein